MQTFLDEVAQRIYQNHEDHLQDICVVLPNRRAGLFLKRALSKAAGKTIWSPDIFSIEDFLIRISGFNKLDNIALTFELYEIHKEIEGEEARDFEQFARWGQVMLADFSETDMHLIDARQLYGYLNEVKAIEKWNPDGRPLTKAERDYLAFYQSLYRYYEKLQQKLTAGKTAYQGLIYRLAAEHIETLSANSSWQKIYFAGFNAITRSEEEVIDYLVEQKNAEIIRDVDEYYLHDPNQEAGEFLRRQLKKTGREKFGPVQTFLKDSSKNIRIHGIPWKEGQALQAARVLDRLAGENPDDRDNIAVVLADESLLLPVVNALPDSAGQFNITMGYPLRFTPPFGFVMVLLRMFENEARFARLEQNKSKGFYYRDILRVIRHSMVSGFYDPAAHIAEIGSSKQVFYQSEEIREMFSDSPLQEFVNIIFAKSLPEPQEVSEIISQLTGHFRMKFQEALKNNPGDREPALQLEYLYHTAIVNKRVQELNEQYHAVISLSTLRDLFRQLSQITRLPFSGEPLRGVQIMGMLETRNLDFKKVILLSANEGILPASTMANSLIPYDIQVEMNMPTHNQKNAVFAYHFYRLLQRADEVHIIYNTESDELGGGEKSRYIRQIESELPRYNPKIKIHESVESLPPPEKLTDRVIEIPKTGNIFESLLERAAKGLAPTSLNQYRRCPLQFYFKYVAGLKETDEVEENLEHKTIGSVVHKVFEDLYKPFTGKIVNADDIRQMKDKTDEMIAAALEEFYQKGQVQFGKNRLLYEVIRNFIASFLDFDSGFVEQTAKANIFLTIVGLEDKVISENLASLFQVPEGSEIILKGVIDRIDKLGNNLRIIDYKTGKVASASDLSISGWEDFEDGDKKDKAFQVMLYAWLYNRSKQEPVQGLTAGIISLPVLSNGLMNFAVREGRKKTEEIDAEMLENFELYLLTLLREIFDTSVPFTQTDNRETCHYCDFREICGR